MLRLLFSEREQENDSTKDETEDASEDRIVAILILCVEARKY